MFKKRQPRKPSPALVVSIAAVVLAASGSAFAAGVLITKPGQLGNGVVTSRAIKNGAVTGEKIASHAITGKNVNFARLGTVPSAKNATHASEATHAASAALATRATVAENATKLDGSASSAFVRSCQGGAVHGFARIIGAPGFSSTYSSNPAEVDPGLKFSCSGGVVRARRVSEGLYYVDFVPSVGLLGFANGEAGALTSVQVVTDPTIDNAKVFEVRISTSGPGGLTSTDRPFTLLVP